MSAQQLKLAFLALLATGAVAEPRFPPIWFSRAYPPDSRVFVQNSSGDSYWGQANEPFAVDERYLARLPPGSTVTLKFRHEGFKDWQSTIDRNYFLPNDGEPPGQPKDMSEIIPVELKPTSTWSRLSYWVRYNPVPTGIAAAILIGLTAWGARQQYRSSRLKALHASSERSDPLLANGPAQLGPYLAVRRLGMGGMATVYWSVPVASLRDEDAVAIKVVQAQFADNPEFRLRFARECKLATELIHPAIVRTIDSNTQEGLLYLVMELVEGQSLKSLIPPEGMPVERALQLLDPVLDGLIYAHQKGVVHRDLKPDNIMVVKGERPKIMDFGLAKSSDVSDVTKTGTALGTPAYLPPEQFLGADLDFRSDQYSLGISLYQMLTGRVPFEGTDPMAVAFRHVNETPPFPRTLRPDLEPALERVILKMICKDPTQRFRDFQEVRAALKQGPQALEGWEYPVPAPRKVQLPQPAERGEETVAMDSGGDATIVGLT